MKNTLLHNYELLISELLFSAGALEVVFRWLDNLPKNNLGYFEFLEFKSQYVDILYLAMAHLKTLSVTHQTMIDNSEQK